FFPKSVEASPTSPPAKLRRRHLTLNRRLSMNLNCSIIKLLSEGWEGSAADSRILRDALFCNRFSVLQNIFIETLVCYQ
ncbi:hypothetical protein HN51_022241, partial [Arachis hypogaea]